MITPGTIKEITPAQAQKILAENGLQVSLDQAAGMVEFLSNFARIILNSLQNQKPLLNEDSLPVHKGEHRRAS
jgi:hypothetical protein